ncbi:MAG: zinc ribbon domain-containing protein [Chloroflexota bacterium]|jgi:RNA polymerase subunit RPABC4/transcription elongation factor Spt4|nr:zinc ribbon domain-containing protein [Anaerolineae bacterium]HMM27731.1 zinc ribbon domain-containing protein [Aggregatilineaceae bacterium]
MIDQDTLNTLLLYAVTACGGVSAALWLGLIIWTWRDMRQRSRDPLAQIAAALVVAVLNVFGLLIYVMLRPPETLAESYERSLEEEALLQNIEEKPLCPGCGRPVKDPWQVCPYCHTKLKKPCVACETMLELPWNICPVCATPQVAYEAAPAAGMTSPATEADFDGAAPADAPVEFVENDPY